MSLTAIRDTMKVDLPEGESGKVRVSKFTLTAEEAAADRLRGLFGGHGRYVPEGTYTQIHVGRTLMMTDTPDEMRDHIEPVIQARALGGRVLINGLGLGMVAQAILELENVEHVDVVELDEDVIKLVAPTYQERYGERFRIHHADAFEQMKSWPRGSKWSVAWHDIWPTISEENLPEIARLKRSYGQRVQWQGAWAEELARQYRQRYSGWGW